MSITGQYYIKKVEGDLSNAISYLTDTLKYKPYNVLRHYGELGVDRLKAATPVDTGNTAAQWYYTITSEYSSGISKPTSGIGPVGKLANKAARYAGHAGQNWVLTFCNSNVQDGFNVAVHLQTGHGTRDGHWVEGIDYINPAIRPIFEDIADGIFEEVAKL